jgi:hypothetical protein
MRGYIKARRQYRRAQLIEMLGGRCVRCGSTDELEFDHIDPATKAFAVGSDMSRAWERLVEEALKCQLLCRPCHVTKGREHRPEPRHSYYRYWYYGCRCPICTEANAEKGRGQRENVGKRWGARSFRISEQHNTPGHRSRAQTRTGNLPVNSRTLCRLSYAGSTGRFRRPDHGSRPAFRRAHKGSAPGTVPVAAPQPAALSARPGWSFASA